MKQASFQSLRSNITLALFLGLAILSAKFAIAQVGVAPTAESFSTQNASLSGPQAVDSDQKDINGCASSSAGRGSTDT
ncbi:hypothetical protein [Pelagicoccus albus]|uniref:Uncharacterized protein n=1 Tax=Pelagicoccus albus TaxID=415222 RepID=A0A7X1EAB0_9BACT|nr:hypothetical protein [Pelagicoccus albus]MBC2606592.1 hypothetical protein [Pelagicoccus albus]